MLRWRIGEVEVTRLVESEAPAPAGMFPFATPEALGKIPWLRPHFVTESGEMLLSIHALLVRTPTTTMLVDTCVGNDKPRPFPFWDRLQGAFLDDLKAAGCDRSDVDVVVCTHLHMDHIGWNTMLVDGAWVPTFPNARYLFGREEYAYWRAQGDGDPMRRAWGFEDSVAPVVDAGLADFVEMDHRVCEEIALEPTPGHTKGHVSVRIRSKGEAALITGDFLHHPCQMARPEWTTPVDFDQAQTVATRRRMLTELTASRTLVIGSHFAAPTAGVLVAEGDAWRFEA